MASWYKQKIQAGSNKLNNLDGLGLDMLETKYCKPDVIRMANEMLQREEQSEEAFLGAQGVLMICGLL